MDDKRTTQYFTQSMKQNKPKLTFMQKLLIKLNLEPKVHPHTRENARRVQQIERGILRPNE